MQKLILALLLFLSVSGASFAQALRGLDKSPLDIAYLPDRFANTHKPGEKPVAKLTYSRPFMSGRELAALAPAGKVWRTGANEASEIRFFQDVEFGGKKVKAGTYSLFTIPGEKEWTIILSNDVDYWGAFSYNEKNDYIRVMAPVSTTDQSLENFTIQFSSKPDKTGVMQMAWGKVLVNVPLKWQ